MAKERDPQSNIDPTNSPPPANKVSISRGNMASVSFDAESLPESPMIMGHPIIARIMLGGTETPTSQYPAQEIDVLNVSDASRQEYQDLVVRANQLGVPVSRLVLIARGTQPDDPQITGAAFLPDPEAGTAAVTLGREGNIRWFGYQRAEEEPEGWTPFDTNESVSPKHLILSADVTGRLSINCLSEAANTAVEAVDVIKYGG